MRRLGDITIAELNEALRLFGDSQKRFMRQEKRAALRSMLFDVPRRSSIGWHCFYQEGPRFLEELAREISPEEIGRRMKRLCSRPYYLTLSIVFCSYFNARQQLLLDERVEASAGVRALGEFLGGGFQRLRRGRARAALQ